MNKKELRKAQKILKQQLAEVRNELKEVEGAVALVTELWWDRKVTYDEYEIRYDNLSLIWDELHGADTRIPSMLSNLEFLITGERVSSFDF